MTDAVLRLRAHDLWTVLENIDAIEILAEDLIGRTVTPARNQRRAAGMLTPVGGDTVGLTGLDEPDGELVMLSHPDVAAGCLLPAADLRIALSATLCALAARELLLSGGVTVAILGPIASTQAHLAVIARYVPDISHVALCFTHGAANVEPRLLDRIELCGIGLSVVPTLADAVFGANLVIATNHHEPHRDLHTLRIGELARGAVLINATGRDLSPELIDQVDQVFVEDFGALEDNLDRRVVATHLAEPTTGPVDPYRDTRPRITADLGQLLTGKHPGRHSAEEIALVELLGVSELNPQLAYRIYEGAVRAGLDARVTDRRGPE